MLHRKVLSTLLLLGLCWTLTVNAQNTVESIRKAYQNVKKEIVQMSENFPLDGMPPEYYHLRVKQNLPATGGHEENIRMYYGELAPEEEGDPYPPHSTTCTLQRLSTTMLPVSFTRSISTMTRGR